MACLKLGFRSRSSQKSIKEADEPGPVWWRGWFKMKKKTKGEIVEVESVRGGEDLWNAAAAAAAEDHGVFPEHLVIMVNGLVGRYWLNIFLILFWCIFVVVSFFSCKIRVFFLFCFFFKYASKRHFGITIVWDILLFKETFWGMSVVEW